MRVKRYHRKDSSYTTIIIIIKVSVKVIEWDRLDIPRESIHKGHLLAVQHQRIFS